MKNWLTIGQFANLIEVSPKALRIYEKMGLIKSPTRGENGYRYYDQNQIEKAKKLKKFKDLGFKLVEIKSLLHADQDLDATKLETALKGRLNFIAEQTDQLNAQKSQIEKILISLRNKTEPLKAQQRRAIMSFYGKVSIVVTGHTGHEKTADYIQKQFEKLNHPIPIIKWQPHVVIPKLKPFILIIEEKYLLSEDFNHLHPDIIVIKGLGENSELVRRSYLKLYSQVGPHVTSVMNADDRSVVELASEGLIKKGRIFYFSKNGNLKSQIKNIGGVVSDGEDIEIFGFNMRPEIIQIKLKKIMTYDDEMAYLSSLGAIIELGFDARLI